MITFGHLTRLQCLGQSHTFTGFQDLLTSTLMLIIPSFSAASFSYQLMQRQSAGTYRPANCIRLGTQIIQDGPCSCTTAIDPEVLTGRPSSGHLFWSELSKDPLKGKSVCRCKGGREVTSRGLQYALLRREVGEADAEVLAIAILPLKVVHKRPCMVVGDWYLLTTQCCGSHALICF